jgi:DNA-directed RNA polymerase subunit alpha
MRKELGKPKGVLWDKKTLRKDYGKFDIKPLERGFATSVGNSLRRVLLSSLEGAAVTYVKIEGVLHEFSTIPGVVEDVPEIILNLRRLSLKLHADKPKVLRLKAGKEGEVTARNISKDKEVEILNPDLYLVTLSRNAKLDIEIGVDKGRGYVPAEEGDKGNQPIGIIPVDSLYSPVKRVKYEVESARVSHVTEYEKLVMEIWTDGSIKPEDALAQAANILRQQLAVFINFPLEEEKIKPEPKGEEEEKKKKKAEEAKRRKILGRDMEELELSPRSSNCLKTLKLKTIGDLTRKTEEELLGAKNFGQRSLKEIKDKLDESGLTLKKAPRKEKVS